MTAVARCACTGSSFPYAVGTAYVVFVDHCPENDLDSSPAQQLNYVDYSAGPAVRRSRRLPDGSFEGVDSRDSLQVAGPWAAANADVPRGTP